jgi:poly(beta-D-mannuronate) lyase
MKQSILVVLLLFLFSFQLQATEYLVGTTYEFEIAVTKVKAGDFIIWKDGLYSDVKIDFSPLYNGTSEERIVLKAQTAGKVSFSGSSQLFISGNYLVVEGLLFEGKCTLENNENVINFKSKDKKANNEANYCRLTNCAIINYSSTEESDKNNYCVNLIGSYNEVDNCTFIGKSNKGPVLVIEYKQEKDYVPGSDVAPSSFHHVHHNYFGYRTYSSNGGEQIRVGTSTTSFSHGINVVEYNYFEEERIEAEIISNKSWDNIYRFNTFIGNDGAMVIRHGQNCFVYGNYFNGKSGRNRSGGIRVINPNNTIFNNYLENIEGGKGNSKFPISIMDGLEGSPLNGYYPADNAIVAYNVVNNSFGPIIKLGIGNKAVGKPFIAPKNVVIVGNTIINTVGTNDAPFEISDLNTTFESRDNIYTNGKTNNIGFSPIKLNELQFQNGLYSVKTKIDSKVFDEINKRLSIHGIKLSEKEITDFNPNWILKKKDVGVSWLKNNK